MECHTSACNTATSHIPGACMSNPRTQYPPFLWLIRNVYIVYALIHTYTSNSLKYASHNCKKESVHMQKTKRANRPFIYKNLHVLNWNQQAKLVILFIMTIFNEFIWCTSPMPVTCHTVTMQSTLLYQALDDPASKHK